MTITAEDLVKKFTSLVLFDTNNLLFIQMVKYSFREERIVYRSFYGASLTFSYFCLSSINLCVLAPVSKSLAWTMFPYDEKIFRLCLLHEDGIVEACIPCSITTRCLRKRNWVAFMIVNFSELPKENGELCMVYGNLNITMVCLRFSEIMLYTVKFLQNKGWTK